MGIKKNNIIKSYTKKYDYKIEADFIDDIIINGTFQEIWKY